MNDDEVLNAVKQTLSEVRMDRPIEAIEQRGRVRRRNHRLSGLLAGGGLVAVAALGLAVPMADQQPGTPAGGGLTAGNGTAGGRTAIQPAAFTLAKQSDGTVKLTLNYKQLLDPDALQKALAGAGIPAVVKAGVLCTPRGEELPQAEQVFRDKEVKAPDGSSTRRDLVIVPSKMPQNSRVYFSVFAVRKGEGLAKISVFLVPDDEPMNCRSIG